MPSQCGSKVSTQYVRHCTGSRAASLRGGGCEEGNRERRKILRKRGKSGKEKESTLVTKVRTRNEAGKRREANERNWMMAYKKGMQDGEKKVGIMGD